MGIAKIILNNTSQIDLTSDTVTAATLLSGYTAHDASGTQITGTASSGGGTAIVVTDVPNSTGTTCQITGDTETYNDYTSALAALGVSE